MREFSGREAALQQIDHYRHADIYPHQEMPITDDTFSKFNSLITKINKHLDIKDGDGYCAYSEYRSGEPGIMIIINKDKKEADKARVFDIMVERKDQSTKILIRDDAGTALNPWQAGGNKKIVNLDGGVLSPEDILTDSQLGGLTHLIEQRLKERPFRKTLFLGFPELKTN